MSDVDQNTRDRVIAVQATLAQMGEQLKTMQEKIDSMQMQASRWKGGLGVILVLGGIMGAFVPLVWNSWFK